MRGIIFVSEIALKSSKPMFSKNSKTLRTNNNKRLFFANMEKILSQFKVLIKKSNSFVIVDDLLATGGTVSCVSSLLHDQRKEILGLITVVELKNLKGRLKLDFPVQSIISIWK